MSNEIQPFELAIAESELDQLRRRLTETRWPEPETAAGWAQGVPLAALRALVAYWIDSYDWRRCEAQLNGWGQSKTRIDGLGIHFLHIRSPEPDALPLILTHGWPGSVLEFHKVIGPLTDPVAYGGAQQDAFHLVIPSLPGYGFSDRPSRSGWTVERIARAWIKLMQRLGYRRWAAQGGDWGTAVTSVIGQRSPPGLVGIHLNVPFLIPPSDAQDLTEEERSILADRKHYEDALSGYAKQQSTQPQTLGYALVDSPTGLAAWIYQRFYDWTDHSGSPETIFTRDELLDNIMLYWLPGTAASSARLYWESLLKLPFGKVDVPTAISTFPRETHRASRRWAEAVFPKLVYFGKAARGGHFAALEQPELFVQELRAGFATMR